MKQAPQGRRHGPELPMFKERLGRALRHGLQILGIVVWSQELDSMTLVVPFQVRMCYNSMKSEGTQVSIHISSSYCFSQVLLS